MFRKASSVHMPIYCPACGKNVNEYNWTLETAAANSLLDRRGPTLAFILWECIQGRGASWMNYRVACPQCHERFSIKRLSMPDERQLVEYMKNAGEAYIYSLM